MCLNLIWAEVSVDEKVRHKRSMFMSCVKPKDNNTVTNLKNLFSPKQIFSYTKLLFHHVNTMFIIITLKAKVILQWSPDVVLFNTPKT